MKFRFASILLAFLVAATLLVRPIGPALAHGHIEVGNYELVIGFHNEPAYQGEPNGLDLFVTDKTTGEPVNDLESALRAEIVFGAATRELELRAQWSVDGAYTADVLPTESGDYTWHIWGDINGTPVDVSMTSGPDTFGSVEAKSLVAFPAAELTDAELRAQTRAAQQSAQLALVVGAIGLVAGIAGLVTGYLGLKAARASREAPLGRPSVTSSKG